MENCAEGTRPNLIYRKEIAPGANNMSSNIQDMGVFCARTISALDRQRAICREPHPVANSVFADLLNQTRGTAFEADHSLLKVKSMEDWKRAVPIRSYKDYRTYIQRQIGREQKVLTQDEPYAFLKTSGTTGEAKLVPTTRHWRLKYRGPALYAQWGLYFKLLRLDAPRIENILDLSWERQTAVQHVNGFPIYSITQRPETLGETDWTPPWHDAPWFAAELKTESYDEALYQRLLMQAFCDVRLIVSVNPSKIIALCNTFAKSVSRLIKDLKNFGGVEHFDKARSLERLLQESPDHLTLTDLWPNLSFIICWNSASARLYEPWLDNLLPDVIRLPFSTTGTEGIVTLPIDSHASAGPLAVDQGLYEFAPVADLRDEAPLIEGTQTLPFSELETGHLYRLVMSQANGLYRYDVGDIYKVVGWIGAVPRLEFAGRGGAFSSFTGEKLTDSDIVTAVSQVLKAGYQNQQTFCCFPRWDTPPHYLLAIEWSPNLLDLNLDEFAKSIDQALSGVNLEYAEKLRSGRLGPMSVIRLAEGAFAKVAQKKISLGTSPSQLKHQWLQRDEATLRTFEEMGAVI